MSTLILYGASFSTYVRAARMACVEKGIGYTLAHDSIEEVRSKAHLNLHPFGKMPAMRHGDFVLYETEEIWSGTCAFSTTLTTPTITLSVTTTRRSRTSCLHQSLPISSRPREGRR